MNFEDPVADPLLACIHMLLGTTDDDAAVVASLRGVRAAFMADLLYRRIDSVADGKTRDRARHLVDTIADGDVGAFVAAPALCEVLRCNLPEAGLLALLEDAAVSAHNGTSCRLALASGLPIDGSLPAALSRPDGGLRAPRFLDAAETDAAVARIDAALDLLRSVYAAGGSLFDGLAGSLVLRADSMRPDETWGSSSGLAVGRVLLANPHLSTSREMLADMLLHETVHCALDCAELVRPMFGPAAMTTVSRIPSPWSANPLSWHAFVHASVVWATLLKFWRLVECRSGGTAQGEKRIAYIVSGFSRIDMCLIEADCRRELSDAAFDALEIAHRYATTIAGPLRVG